MDSQHRHELQENELAHWLERQVEAAKPHLPLILFGLVALGVAIWGLGLLRSSNLSARESAWSGYSAAIGGTQPSLPLLESVTEELEGTDAAMWAGITLADGKLFIASQLYLTNRTTSTTALDEAKTIYQRLRGASDSRVRGRAVFGLARAAELEGEIDLAKELYGQVTGPFAEAATARVDYLGTNEAVGDIAWLSTAKPTVRRPPGLSAGPGVPGGLPDFAVDAIETPDSETPATADPADTQTGEEAIDDILSSVEQEEVAAAEVEADAVDLQPAEPATPTTEENPVTEAADEADEAGEE